jgi:hypothetical protein
LTLGDRVRGPVGDVTDQGGSATCG